MYMSSHRLYIDLVSITTMPISYVRITVKVHAVMSVSYGGHWENEELG
jgi:hypothetical protein